MKNLFLVFSCFLIAFNVTAQWKPLALNYKYVKHKEFFIPLSMHFSDSTNGFILNNDHLLQYKNQVWQPVNKNDSDEFTYTNVYTLNPTNTFLCSYDGKVAKYNGDSLTVVFKVPATETSNPVLNTIFMIDSSKGWAAGDGGILIKIDNDTFEQENISGTINFRDIYFDRQNHGWMIGLLQNDNGNFGVVYEYANGQWFINTFIDEILYDIEFSSPGNGFITGKQAIYHYNNQLNEWQQENIPDYYPQYHLSMLNDDYGMSVSDNSRNLIYQNGIWSAGQAAAVTDLLSVKAIEPGKAWAISQIGENDPLDFNKGKIQLMENSNWITYSIDYLDSTSILPVDYAIFNAAGVGKKDIWLNGQYLNIPENKDWFDTIPTIASDTFFTVAKMMSNNFGLATNGDLLEWNGQYWLNKHLDNPNSDTSYINLSMHVFEDTTAFICRQYLVWSSGDFQNTISSYDYKTNRLVNTKILDTRSTYGIHFSDKRNGWCVGDSGLMVRFKNNNWQILPDLTQNRLNSIYAIDSVTAWAAGNNGTLLNYNGINWVQQPLPTIQHLNSIYFTDRTHGWITGDSGIIFRYNGTAWEKDTATHTTNALYAIYMVDSSYGFACGENGTLLQYNKRNSIIPNPPGNLICESGSTYFYYHPEGIGFTYQWQIDTGNGFINLVNDNVYSGVFSDTLRIATLLPGFYGYKYRCIASLNGIDSVSNIEELIYKNHWTGRENNAWENAANWSCGMLPGRNTDVEISNGNVVISSAVAIRSLRVLAGVHIIIAEGGGLTLLK